MGKNDMQPTTPFHDKDGALHSPLRAILDHVVIWPLPEPEYLGKKSLIEIPQEYRLRHRDGVGVLLSIGPGYYKDSGVFRTVSDMLNVGDVWYFDKSVPWTFLVNDYNGNEQLLFICGEQDLIAKVV